MSDEYKRLKANVADFRKDVLLSCHTSFSIGGPARLFVEVRSKEELVAALQECRRLGERYLVLGKGSNTLFDDRGYNGVVILNRIDYLIAGEEGCYEAGAGMSFALLGVRSARAGWAGLEFASGIPGSVGGAVVMNAGANGQETGDCLERVDWIDPDGRLVSGGKEVLRLGYRSSRFQASGEVVVAAHFRLKSCSEARRRQIAIVEERRRSQPYGVPSAGCIFRNPAGGRAGQLIDQCGLKGMRVGGAEVSSCHANFVVNAEGATAADVLELAAQVQARVRALCGVELQPEVQFIPYE